MFFHTSLSAILAITPTLTWAIPGPTRGNQSQTSSLKPLHQRTQIVPWAKKTDFFQAIATVNSLMHNRNLWEELTGAPEDMDFDPNALLTLIRVSFESNARGDQSNFHTLYEKIKTFDLETILAFYLVNSKTQGKFDRIIIGADKQKRIWQPTGFGLRFTSTKASSIPPNFAASTMDPYGILKGIIEEFYDGDLQHPDLLGISQATFNYGLRPHVFANIRMRRLDGRILYFRVTFDDIQSMSSIRFTKTRGLA